MSGRGAVFLGVVAGLCLAAPTTPALAATPSPLHPHISLSASQRTVPAGAPVTLSGRVKGEVTPVKIDLYSIPWPYRTHELVASTVTAADGSFSFRRHPGLNTRYHATISGTHVHAVAKVSVVARVIQWEKALPLGRAKIVVVLLHPRNLPWRGAKVNWWFAPGKSRFHQATSTRAHRLSQTKL